MDANAIAERIQNPQLLQSDKHHVWEKIIADYPYFSIAQWLKFGYDSKHQKNNFNALLLHQTDPLQFARFRNKLKASTITHSIPTSKNVDLPSIEDIEKDLNDETDLEEIVTIKEAEKVSTIDEVVNNVSEEKITEIESVVQEEKNDEDILALINDLPNSLAFELSQSSSHIETFNPESYAEVLYASDESNKMLLIDHQENDSALMVMMSFTDWLNHFKQKSANEKQENQEKKALKTAWQKEKLAEAADEEIDEIPEPIFKQAMESISMESGLISEALAEILAQQGKLDKAIAMYKKLSLRNPEKSTYFADRIHEITTNYE